MKLPRREFLHLAAGAAALPAVSRIARAQDYPARPLRIVVAFPPGSTSDLVIRPIAQRLQERLGQPAVIDNRSGAGGNIGTEAVVRAPADGYTLLVVTTANAVNTTLYEKLSFDFIRDIAPIAGIAVISNVMLVNPAVPAKTLPEFIAYAKANPGKINMASGGIGAASHIAGELFKMMAGVDMVHVPYRGSPPALTDLLGGQVQGYFSLLPPALEHVRAGKLRALALTSATRSQMLADLPAIAEFVPGYEASSVWGLGAPKDTPAAVIEKLNREVNAVLAEPKINETLLSLGGTVLAGSPAEFGKLMAEETEKWGKVIRTANIRPE